MYRCNQGGSLAPATVRLIDWARQALFQASAGFYLDRLYITAVRQHLSDSCVGVTVSLE